MDGTFSRFAFRLLVLLACAVAVWRGGEPTPSREVVEVVSVVFKPARVEAAALAEVARPEAANLQTATPAPPPNPDRVATPRRSPQQRASAPVQHAKAAPRPESAASRSAKTTAAPTLMKASCRPPTCRAATPIAKAAVGKRPGTRQALKAEPPPPRVLVPVRRLGLYLQARLEGPRDDKAAPARRKGSSRA